MSSDIYNQMNLTPSSHVHVIEYIGDEVTAAGYRLCGVNVQIADRRNVFSLVQQACEHASLVLLGSGAAQYLHSTELDTLMANTSPPVLVVPDVCGKQSVPDIATRIHKQLGMLE